MSQCLVLIPISTESKPGSASVPQPHPFESTSREDSSPSSTLPFYVVLCKGKVKLSISTRTTHQKPPRLQKMHNLYTQTGNQDPNLPLPESPQPNNQASSTHSPYQRRFPPLPAAPTAAAGAAALAPTPPLNPARTGNGSR